MSVEQGALSTNKRIISHNVSTHLEEINPPHYVSFRLADKTYALPLSHIENVLRMVAISPLVEAPIWIAGVIDLHGRVLPVIDLHQRFGQPAKEPNLGDRLLVVQIDGQTAALIVDEAIEVLEGPANIEDAPDDILSHSNILDSVIRREDGLIQILNPARLLPDCLEDSPLPELIGLFAEGYQADEQASLIEVQLAVEASRSDSERAIKGVSLAGDGPKAASTSLQEIDTVGEKQGGPKVSQPTEGEDLTTIKGIGAVYTRKLQAGGIRTFTVLARGSAKEIADLLSLPKGRIAEVQGWIDQAAELVRLGESHAEIDDQSPSGEQNCER